MVVQIYYIKGLVLCQIVVLTSWRIAGIKLCAMGSRKISIFTRHSQTVKISKNMSRTIAMGFMRAALLLRFSMSVMENIQPINANIMPVWIVWMLANAIAADGVP